jgi:stalled ribosome rescue protein Dom34
MTSQYSVWIDHKEARIFQIQPDTTDATTVHAGLKSTHHRHPKGAAEGKDHPEDAKRFFQEVAGVLEGAQEILVLGPSTAKLELSRYLHKHAPKLEARIVGIETVDHPSDGQVVAYAKKYFDRSDRQR